MQKEKKMSQEKTKKIQKCPLCAKHCSVNNLVCARGYQLFDDSCRHSSCPFVTVFLLKCQHGHSIFLFYHLFSGIEALFMIFLYFLYAYC